MSMALRKKHTDRMGNITGMAGEEGEGGDVRLNVMMSFIIPRQGASMLGTLCHQDSSCKICTKLVQIVQN